MLTNEILIHIMNFIIIDPVTFSISDEDVLRLAGLDALVYLRFLRLLFVAIGVSTIVGFVGKYILLLCGFTGPNTKSIVQCFCQYMAGRHQMRQIKA